MSQKKPSKQELLKLIAKLRKNPKSKHDLLADLGIAGIGMIGSGSLAAFLGAGTASIGYGVTALTGTVFVVAAPVGLVAGAAVAGGAAAYGITQAVKLKARQQGRCEQILQQLEEMLRDIKYKETKAQTTELDRTKFVLFLEEPIQLNLMSHEDAINLILLVENGQINLFEAYSLVKDILKEFEVSKAEKPVPLLPTLLPGVAN